MMTLIIPIRDDDGLRQLLLPYLEVHMVVVVVLGIN
jgi:hypothetical protein